MLTCARAPQITPPHGRVHTEGYSHCGLRPGQPGCIACNPGAAVCNGVAKTLGLNASGKRNMLGATMSPRNNEWLNGTHPAMLFKQRCNSDVKATYRIPIMKDTHCKNRQLCNVKGCLSTPFSELMRIQAQSQRDQIGYITDYITKR